MYYLNDGLSRLLALVRGLLHDGGDERPQDLGVLVGVVVDAEGLQVAVGRGVEGGHGGAAAAGLGDEGVEEGVGGHQQHQGQ